MLGFLFYHLKRLHAQLERQNDELRALHQAALDVGSELELPALLQRIVDIARELIGARYGALAIYDDQGAIQSFHYSGLTAEEARRIGDPPRGRGLLGLVLREGERLRLENLSSHPKSAGFPPGHPLMRTLLAVPVRGSGPFRGNLYLCDREEGLPFSASDEETLLRFATQAALALERSHAHARLRALAVAEERLRIARELHDSVAQVLAFVNAKSQAIQEQLRSGRIAEAQAQLARLAAASRETYTDVRESILALRAAGEEARPLAEALRDYSERWEDQTGIAVQLKLQADPELPPGVQTQLLRITQEALANVRKHSAAKEVTVQLTKEGPYLQLLVRDNGCGFDVGAQADAKKPSFGLTSMRERASSIGAELCVESEPNRGTTVQVRLPLRSYRELADVIEQAP
jgi:signal transduction histidine kinase